MSVKATGQITLVDLTDGQLTAYLSANLPKTQIYNSKENSFSPDWRDTNLQIVPNVSLNQRGISLDQLTITFKKQVGTGDEQNLDGINEIVNNGRLTINANLLENSATKSITYIAYISYQQRFSARADLTFTLLNEGVDGDDGDSGLDGYTIFLSNESYLFKGGNNAALGETINTVLSCYRGATEQRVRIISVDGVTANATNTNTTITGLQFKVSSISAVNSPTITFISTTNLTQRN